jgi:hypothetical protein
MASLVVSDRQYTLTNINFASSDDPDNCDIQLTSQDVEFYVRMSGTVVATFLVEYGALVACDGGSSGPTQHFARGPCLPPS